MEECPNKEGLTALAHRWRAEATAHEFKACHQSGKWYGAMTDEEKAAFNSARDVAYGMRVCANELLARLRGERRES